MKRIPKYFLFYVRPNKYFNSDNKYRLPIDNFSFTYNNEPNIMKTYSTNRLYEISLKNNLSMSPNSFKGTIYTRNDDDNIEYLGVGPVIIFKTDEDLYFRSDIIIPGMKGNYIEIKCDISNPSVNTVPEGNEDGLNAGDPNVLNGFTFYMTCIDHKPFEIEDNKCVIHDFTYKNGRELVDEIKKITA